MLSINMNLQYGDMGCPVSNRGDTPKKLIRINKNWASF